MVEAAEVARSVALDWLARYADAVDTADLLALSRLCATVTVHAPTGAVATGSAVADIYAPIVVVPQRDGRRRTKHHITNVPVQPGDDGTALVRAYYLLVKDVDGQPGIAASGRYETLVVQKEATWSVVEHRVTRAPEPDLSRTWPPGRWRAVPV